MATALSKAHTLTTLTSAAPARRVMPRPCSVSVFAASTTSKTGKQAKRQPREENVGLESKKAFYVDHTCIGEHCFGAQGVTLCKSVLHLFIACW